MWANCNLSNSTFNTTESPWTYATFDGSVGNPPGSIVESAPASACVAAFSECIPFAAGETCDFSAQFFVAAGQPTDGSLVVHYQFFLDPTCTVTSFATSSQVSTTTAQQNTWVSLDTGSVVAPPGAQGAKAIFTACGRTSSVVVHVDNAVSSAPSVVAVPALGRVGMIIMAGALVAAAAMSLRKVRQAN